MLHRTTTLELAVGGGDWRREKLIEGYTASDGTFYLGHFLQEADLLAAEMASEQAHGDSIQEGSSLGVVTISMQSDPIVAPLSLGQAYLLDKRVSYTKGKSVGVDIYVLRDTGHSKEYVTTLHFTFQARKDGKPVDATPAVPSTQLEAEIAKAAHAKGLSFFSASQPISQLEQGILDEVRRREGGRKYVSVADTAAHTPVSFQVGSRNPHGAVYGGDILKLMFDRAWHEAARFIGGESGLAPLPIPVGVVGATFNAPLPIGYLVDCATSTIFTGETSLIQHVTLTAYDPAGKQEPRLTNTGTFAFVAIDGERNHAQLRRGVVPTDPAQEALWLKGLRARQQYEAGKGGMPLMHEETSRMLAQYR